MQFARSPFADLFPLCGVPLCEPPLYLEGFAYKWLAGLETRKERPDHWEDKTVHEGGELGREIGSVTILTKGLKSLFQLVKEQC